MRARAICTMLIAAGVLVGGMYACTPEKAGATAAKASEWSTRRCRCNRHDARGCVHWVCRRVP